jgi:predicted phage tail protein
MSVATALIYRSQAASGHAYPQTDEQSNSAKVGDTMNLQSYTEVIDAKLRYPNTALLYIEFDSSQFNGSIPRLPANQRSRNPRS